MAFVLVEDAPETDAGLFVEQMPVDGAPQVGVVVTGVEGESVLSVEVSWDGGSTWHGVRGAQREAVSGAAFFRDFVPPLNVEATYRVLLHSGALLPAIRYEWEGAPHSSRSRSLGQSGVMLRENRATNPHAASATGWIFNNGTGGASTVTTQTGTDTPDGHAGYRRAVITTPDTGGSSGWRYVQDGTEAGAIGDSLTVSMYVRYSVATTVAPTLTLRSASAGAGQIIGPPVTAPANTWTRLAVTITAAATYDGFQFWVRDSVAGPGVGTTIDATMVLAERASLLREYIDGDTPAVEAVTEATITVPSDTAWIQDPLDPRGAVPVVLNSNPDQGEVWLTSAALASATWEQASDVVFVEGARYPVASIGQRIAASEIPIGLAYEVMAEGGALRRLLANSGALVLRGMPDELIDPVAHVAVGNATEKRVGSGAHQIATWDLSARMIRPTSMKVVVPWWTYDQVKALWDAWTPSATYDQVIATRPGGTYLDWQRDPEVP